MLGPLLSHAPQRSNLDGEIGDSPGALELVTAWPDPGGGRERCRGNVRDGVERFTFRWRDQTIEAQAPRNETEGSVQKCDPRCAAGQVDQTGTQEAEHFRFEFSLEDQLDPTLAQDRQRLEENPGVAPARAGDSVREKNRTHGHIQGEIPSLSILAVPHEKLSHIVFSHFLNCIFLRSGRQFFQRYEPIFVLFARGKT